MAVEERHLISLPSVRVEVKVNENDPDSDEIWVNDGSAIFAVDDWERALKFVERVRNF